VSVRRFGFSKFPPVSTPRSREAVQYKNHGKDTVKASWRWSMDLPPGSGTSQRLHGMA
jgi:hypothetical protein